MNKYIKRNIQYMRHIASLAIRLAQWELYPPLFFTVLTVRKSVLLCNYKLWSLSAHQQKSLPALRLSLLNSQQSLIQPPQQGVKPVPGSTPPAIVPGPAVRIRQPNSVGTTTGASALPAGTLGHAAAMVCIDRPSWYRLNYSHSLHLGKEYKHKIYYRYWLLM